MRSLNCRMLKCFLCLGSALLSNQLHAQQIESVSSRFVAQTTDQDDQIGFCRKCKHPGPGDCPSAQKDWDEYARKWGVAQELFDHAANDLKQVEDQRKKYVKDEGIALLEITAAKGGIIAAIKAAMKKYGMAAGAKVLGGATSAFGLYTTYEWIRWDVYPEIRDHDRALKDIGKEVEAASKLAQEAIAAMKRALAAEALCEKQAAKDDAGRAQREALVDKAKQLREKWALEGSPLYKDPNDPSAYPMNAAAALKRAIDILSAQGKNGGAANLPQYFRTQNVQLVSWTIGIAKLLSQTSNGSPSQDTYTYTLDQANAALAQVKSAEKTMQDGHALTEKQYAFEDSWGAQLADVAAQMRQYPPQPR